MIYAYPLSIMAANPKLKPWVMENYIIPHTYQPIKDLPTLRMCYMDAYSFSESSNPQSFIHQDNYVQNYVATIDICGFIKHMIDDNKYVIAFSDDYYLPNSSFTMHYLHETLYYGYDDDRDVFKAAGLNPAGAYSNIEHAFDDVRRAFSEGHTCEVHGNIEWARRHRVIVLSVPDYTLDYPYDRRKVINKLGNFCEGKADDVDIFRLNIQNRGKFYFGIDYYTFIADNLTADYGSFRYIHHIHEHISLLHDRLLYLLAVVNKPTSILSTFHNVTKSIGILRLKGIKGMQTSDISSSEKLIRESRSQLYSYIEDLRKCIEDILDEVR